MFFLTILSPPRSTLFPYTTLFRSLRERVRAGDPVHDHVVRRGADRCGIAAVALEGRRTTWSRSEEHTSELQSHSDLVCRLLLEKKKGQSRSTSDDPFGRVLTMMPF